MALVISYFDFWSCSMLLATMKVPSMSPHFVKFKFTICPMFKSFVEWKDSISCLKGTCFFFSGTPLGDSEDRCGYKVSVSRILLNLTYSLSSLLRRTRENWWSFCSGCGTAGITQDTNIMERAETHQWKAATDAIKWRALCAMTSSCLKVLFREHFANSSVFKVTTLCASLCKMWLVQDISRLKS